MLVKGNDLEFQVKGLTLQAQQWGNPGDKRVLALHGWLDNSNSFAPLAEKLSGIHLVALDMAGHGKSSYRSADAAYNIWQDTGEIFDIADQLNWKEFSFLGHSRGAFIALISTGTFPQRIQQLAMIDAFIPPMNDVSEAPQQLARSIISNRRYSNHKRVIYPSQQAGIESRIDSRIPITQEAVAYLAERGLKQNEEGYSWSADPRLQAASQLRLTPQQYQLFLDAVNCQTLVISGEESMMRSRLLEGYQAMAEQNPLFELITLPGAHHLHMDQHSVDPVADVVNQFFGKGG